MKDADTNFLDGCDLPALIRAYLTEHCEMTLKPLTVRQYRALLEETLALTQGTPFYNGQTSLRASRRAIKALLMTCHARHPVKFNRWRAVLGSCFAWGVANDLVTANPVYGLPSLPEKPRERVLGDRQLSAWFAVTRAGRYARNTIDGLYLILLTGMRPGELLSVTAGDVDLADHAMVLHDTKNGRAHRVPLSEPAQLLVKRNLAFNDRLITTSLHGLGQVCRRSTAKAGATVCSPHDLRRTCATLCGRLGVPTETIARILNHSTGGVTTRHYALYAYDREKRAALEQVADHLVGLGLPGPHG